jgi:hypothetical protein
MGARTADGGRPIETGLCQIPGVQSVECNPLTENVLIRFDPAEVSAARLLSHIAQISRTLVEGTQPQGSQRQSSALLQVGFRGVVGHAVVDSLWFAPGYLGKSLGLPLAGLGPLHVALDVLVLGLALGSVRTGKSAAR